MPTWPAAPIPHHVSAPGIIDPVLRFSVDQGYEVRRSRWSRSRRLYQVTYLGTANDILTLFDFLEREIRGGSLSFSWAYPFGQKIQSINTDVPNHLQTQWIHGLQSGDFVSIAGTVAHNAVYQVQRISFTGLNLLGTSGGTAEGTGGTLAPYFPFMSLQLEGDILPPPEVAHDFGAFRDNDSLTRVSFTFREEFA